MAKRTKKSMRHEQAIEQDLFAEEFFSEPPPAPVEATWEDQDHERPKLAPSNRRAMIATIAIFSVFALGLGAFFVYTRLVMPTPVALGATSAGLPVPQAAPIEPAPIAAVPSATTASPTPLTSPLIAAAPTANTAPAAIEPVAAEPVAVVEPVAAEPVAAVEPVAAEPVAAIEPAPATPAVVVEPVARRAAPKRTTARRAAGPAPAASVDENDLGTQAMRALNAGRASDARRLAQQAVQAHPERADGWIVLGAASDALGDHAAAHNAYASCTARAFGPRVATCRALAR